MTAVSFMLILDAMMIALLSATVFYCLKLNVRIKVLQDSKEEFSKLIERFDATTQRAQHSIEELQNVSKKVNEQLSGRLDKANFLADDLAFMIEKGSKLADKMEGRVRSDAPRPEPKQAAPQSRNMQSGPALKPNKGEGDNRASLEAMLNRNKAARDEFSDEAEMPRRRPVPTARLRSKAEQELFDALKSGGNS